MSNEGEALRFGVILDGEAGGREVGWDEIRGWHAEQGPLWIHLDLSHDEACNWLEDESGLSALVAAALSADETRPRCSPLGGGLLLILRGVNAIPGADPEDMVSLRIWCDGTRAISVRKRYVAAVADIRAELQRGEGPATVGGLVASLCERLVDRMSPIIDDLEHRSDALEDQAFAGDVASVRNELADLRRDAILLRRYVGPQRDATARLQLETAEFLSENHRSRLREVTDATSRILEALDAVRERATVTQDHVAGQLSEQTNRVMYVLSVVTALFLPPALLTGLLGINVGGVPGTEVGAAFGIVVGVLVLMIAAEWAILRWLRIL